MLENITSSYILKRIYNFLTELKKLKILNYSNKLQKKSNISILDYKEYAEIEIELNLIDNPNNLNNYFISPNFAESSSLHIYYNWSNCKSN